jgi:hypothetical protein
MPSFYFPPRRFRSAFFWYLESPSVNRSRIGETEFNRYLVRLELQADYLAGV